VTGIFLPDERAVLGRLPSVAGGLEAAGYASIWSGEVGNTDAVVPAALVASATRHSAVAVVLNVYTRAPTALAMSAATMGDVAPGRCAIVLGASSPLFVERWNGIPFTRPVARMRDVLGFLRRALAGGRVRGEFETFTSDGFRLQEAPAEPPSLLVAASSPNMTRLASREADGVVINWVTALDVERLSELPSDRSRVTMLVVVCPTDDRTAMDGVARPLMASYLAAPAYAQVQRRVGRGPALAQMWDAWDRGDAAAAQRALPDDVIDELIVWGAPAECRARLAAIRQATGAGVVTMALQPDRVTFDEAALSYAPGAPLTPEEETCSTH
jgi:probable F420-dependent oxidoreductase